VFHPHEGRMKMLNMGEFVCSKAHSPFQKVDRGGKDLFVQTGGQNESSKYQYC